MFKIQVKIITMFGSTFIRIDFEWINYVKLIMDKS